MSKFQIALIQLAYDSAPGAMIEKYRLRVAEAAKAGASLVVLPELSLSPYGAGRVPGEAEPLPESIPGGETCVMLSEIAKENGVFVLGSLYERGGLGGRKQKGPRFNSAVIMDRAGMLGGGCRKLHVGLNPQESEYYSGANSDYPVFRVEEAAVAMPTGEDLWFPELARIYGLKGASVIASPAAVGSRKGAPFQTPEAWTTMLRSHAIANGIFVAVANRVGTENGRTFHGSSMIIAPGGEVLAQGSADGEEIVVAELDLDLATAWRKSFPLLLKREPQTYGVVMARLTEERTPE